MFEIEQMCKKTRITMDKIKVIKMGNSRGWFPLICGEVEGQPIFSPYR